MRWILAMATIVGCGVDGEESAVCVARDGGAAAVLPRGPQPGDRDYVPVTDEDFYRSQEILEARRLPGETEEAHRRRLEDRRIAEIASRGKSKRPGAGTPPPPAPQWNGPVTTEQALGSARNLDERCGRDAGN